MIPVLVTDRCVLLCGDSRELALGEGVIDAVVTDPPYELGFMGRKWDASGIAYDVALWARVLAALKPGGHLLAFGGTRTYHRMACAIEDALFEIRDSLHWIYGSGFPKSLNVSKAIDTHLLDGSSRPEDIRRRSMGDEYEPSGRGRVNYDHGAGSVMNGRSSQTCVYLKAGQSCQGHDSGHSQGKTFHAALTAPGSPEAERWSGWGTALKPAHEPIVLARKPLAGTVAANVLAHGTGGLNVDGCRIETTDDLNGGCHSPNVKARAMAPGGAPRTARAGAYIQPAGRWPANVVLSHAEGCVAWWDKDTSTEGIDCAPGCPVAELDRQSGHTKSPPPAARNTSRQRVLSADTESGGFAMTGGSGGYADAGGASRFFYCAKPSRRERDFGCEDMPQRTGGEATDRVDGSAGLANPRAGAGRTGGARNFHPTVKPIELMRYLCRLVTPPGGVVLDPFTGSGTTGIAALREGFAFIGVEQSPEYAEIAKARLLRELKEPCK